jgi:hypothetical protein
MASEIQALEANHTWTLKALPSAVNGSSRLSFEHMSPLKGTMPALWLKATLKLKGLITMIPLHLLPSLSPFIVSLPSLQPIIGLSISWMFIMLFYMETLKKRSTWPFHPIFARRGRIEFVVSTNYFTNLKKPLTIGFPNFLQFLLLLVSTISS